MADILLLQPDSRAYAALHQARVPHHQVGEIRSWRELERLLKKGEEFLIQAVDYRRSGHERTDRMLNEAPRGPAFAHEATRPWAERALAEGVR